MMDFLFSILLVPFFLNWEIPRTITPWPWRSWGNA